MRKSVRRWLIGLVVLAVLLVVVDRVAASVAQRTASTWLARQAEFVGKPTVKIHGFPFLTQAISGDFDDIEVSGRQVRLDTIVATAFDVHVRGAHIGLSDVLGKSLRAVRCSQVDGSITVSYAEIAGLTTVPGLSLTWDNSVVVARATVTVNGVSRAALGTGTVTVSGGQLRLAVHDVTVDGQALPPDQVAGVEAVLNLVIALPTLPYQLALESAVAGPAGLKLGARATNVVLGSG